MDQTLLSQKKYMGLKVLRKQIPCVSFWDWDLKVIYYFNVHVSIRKWNNYNPWILKKPVTLIT